MINTSFLGLRGAKLLGLFLIVAFVLGFGLLAISKTSAEELIVENNIVETAPSAEESAVPIEESAPIVEEVVSAPAEAPAEVVPVQAPELSTDKDDYHPGETATIFGKFFQSLGNFVLKIFGSDENDQNYTESSVTVTADESGAFSSAYKLDDLYRPFYWVTASSQAGEELAKMYFRDSSIGTYDQCSNDLGTGYTTGDVGCRWINGNLNANNSIYFEHDATVQRFWLEGLAPGSQHTVTFKYGTTKGGKHAYDFLTDWNHSENWISVADRCQDIAGCTTASETTSNIPVDVNAGGFDVAAGTQKMTIRGGTISNVSTPTIVSGTYAGDSETVTTITFTTGPSNGSMCDTKQGITSCGVAIWFGAHVSAQADWGAGNSAVNISGSPYHVALEAIDGGSVGQRDNQMQSATVVANGSITIVKDAVPNNAQDFAFTTTGTGLSNFSLDDDADGTLPNTRTFTGLASGTYTVDEGSVAGWSLTNLVCVDPTTNSSVNVGTGVATINLAAGESVTCTYTNTLQTGHIIVVKDAVPNDAQDFSFTNNFANGNPSPFSLDDDADATLSNTRDSVVNAGTYSVSEGAVAGWSQTSATCSDGSPVNAIVVSPGETVTCTFVNTKLTSSVVTELHKADESTVADGGSVALGTIMHDKATVSANIGTPTGTVAFTFFNNGTCSGQGTAAGTVALVSGVAHPATSQGPLGAGSYSFKARYNGDGNYPASDSACEPFSVNKAQLAITTTIHDASHGIIPDNSSVAVGSTAHDNATVTGAVLGFSIPAISFTFDGGAIANGSTEGGFSATSVATGALSAGNHKFNATVASDSNYIGATSADEPFKVVDARISIGTSGTNEVGNPHTFTVTVEKNDGSGWTPASGITITPSVSGSAVLTGTGTCQTGSTDASGQCTIIVNSSSAGVGTVNASGTVLVSGLSIPVATNGSGAFNVSNTKTWVDAKIILSPLTATNNITDPHTITATVSQNDGSGWSSAPNGTLVTFSLLNNTAGAAFVGGINTCTTTSGACSVQINSSTPGSVDIHATTTFTVGGVSLTRASDGTHGSSGDANKLYVAGALHITKVLDVSAYSPLPLGNVDGTFTVVVTGPSYPGGHNIVFTMVDGVLQAPTTVHLEPLIPGAYTVTENDPGIAWTVSGNGGVTVVANQTATKTITNTIKRPHTTISISANTQETQPGQNVILTIADTNDGQVPLNNPTVELTWGANSETLGTIATTSCTAATESGTVNGIMDVGETWTWTCTILITGDTTFNVAGHGTDSFGTDVSPQNGVTTEAGSIIVKVIGTTRTIGFWQTHTNFTSSVFNLAGMQKYVGINSPVVLGSHKGQITNGNPSQLFGGFYAPIAKTSTGAKRSPVDQARITLLQQLLAAKLNCAAFGCSSATATNIAGADTAYAGNDKNAIMSYVSILDAFNNSGDSGAIPATLPATGKATPDASKVIADLAFWNLP